MPWMETSPMLPVYSVTYLPGCTSTYSSSRNCSTDSPASRAIPPMVNALTGLCRGMVTMRTPLLMTMCFP